MDTLWHDETLVALEMPVIPPRCVTGDIWVLAEHRLLCGDATNLDDVTRLLEGKVAALGLHDPPYGLRARMSWGFGDGKQWGNAAAPRGMFAPIANDQRQFDPRHLVKSGKVVVIWGANHFADKLPASPAWIIWDKRDGLPSNDQSDGEVAWVSTGNTLRIFRHRWNGMIRASEQHEPRLHPTQKPIKLFSAIIKRYTQPGDLVTDWYAGSGTTLLACEFTKRKAACIEIETAYGDVILHRFEQATGKQAVLISRM